MKKTKNKGIVEKSVLKTWGKGGKAKEGSINWKENVGVKIPFTYNDIKGEFEICDYNNSYLTLKYNEVVCGKKIYANSFLNGNIGGLIGEISKEFKYEIGDTIHDDNRSVTIIDRKYVIRKHVDGNDIYEKYYRYKCNICGFNCGGNYKKGEYREEHWIVESGLKNKKGCSVCCTPSQIIVPHINSIKAKAPWMIDLGVSEEDSLRYAPQSNVKVKIVCPDCGRYKERRVGDIYRRKGISCGCGDWRSYPEKFMDNVLTQLGVEFKSELNKTTFGWCKNYRYDFYIPSLNMIIETHGVQHYENSPRGRGLEEEQYNDKLKKELALKNGIQRFEVIDCRESNMEWVKNSIINSDIGNIFDLNLVDFTLSDMFAIKNNRVKDICDYWKSKRETETTSDLESVFKCSGITIRRCLKAGTKIGWCNYDPNLEVAKCAIKCNKLKGKPVEIFKEGKSLGVFENCHELERQSIELFGVNLGNSAVAEVCRGSRILYKGYTFSYINKKEVA